MARAGKGLGPTLQGWAAAAAVAVAVIGLAAHGPAFAQASGAGYENLIELFKEFQTWKAQTTNVLATDYSAAAVTKRAEELAAFRKRLDALDVSGWQREQKSDWLIVRSELDQQEFIFKITRPWARDPMFYGTDLRQVAFTSLPVKGQDLEKLRTQLRAVPKVVAQAKENLTDVPADYADYAIKLMVESDGVEDGYPYRTVPPAGVVGWYEDLLGRAQKQQPALAGDIRKAHAAVKDFHQWLVANRPRMNGRAGVGKAALDWFLRHGLLIPYTSDEVVTLCQRELDRMWAFYALERHRNRALPEIEISSSGEEYRRRLEETDKLVRNWLEKEEYITIPPYIPQDLDEMGFNVPWIERQTPPNFWEQVQYRDPVPDHLHAVIPGHRFDDHVRRNNPHPIRGQVRSHARWQGWAVYLEEGPLQGGLLEERPRSRELIYVFGLWRAARSLGDVYNQRNEMTAPEVVKWWLEVTPFLDPNVARKYAHLRPIPGHGLDYTVGNIQMFNLLAERKRQLRDRFVLKDFHDELMTKGQIPFALIRYEMTGYDKDVNSFFNDYVPLSALKH